MKKLTYISLLLCCMLLSGIAYGQNFAMKDVIANAPSPKKLVNDFANILTDLQKEALETKLVRFDDSTSTQITVVIVPRLDGLDVDEAATDLGRKWGVGGKQNNNGVVLLVSEEDRKLSISPGYGLEGALPDITCKEIIDGNIVPEFKEKDYYRGIDEGTTAIMDAARGVYTAPAGYNKKSGSTFGKIIGYIVLIIILLVIFGGGSKGGSFMSSRGFAAWTIGSMLGGGGGSSGGGGGGGGGFGGFGGGSFGGGGASGSW